MSWLGGVWLPVRNSITTKKQCGSLCKKLKGAANYVPDLCSGGSRRNEGNGVQEMSSYYISHYKKILNRWQDTKISVQMTLPIYNFVFEQFDSIWEHDSQKCLKHCGGKITRHFLFQGHLVQEPIVRMWPLLLSHVRPMPIIFSHAVVEVKQRKLFQPFLAHAPSFKPVNIQQTTSVCVCVSSCTREWFSWGSKKKGACELRRFPALAQITSKRIPGEVQHTKVRTEAVWVCVHVAVWLIPDSQTALINNWDTNSCNTWGLTFNTVVLNDKNICWGEKEESKTERENDAWGGGARWWKQKKVGEMRRDDDTCSDSQPGGTRRNGER